jgi:hypothetical protein
MLYLCISFSILNYLTDCISYFLNNRLSPLYTSGSCLSPNDNNKSGCSSSNGTVISGSVSSAGTRVPLNSTTPLCNEVFSDGSTSITSLAGATTPYTRGTVTCGPSYTAYLYFQNNCPALPGSNQSEFTITVEYTTNYPSCSGSNGVYNDYYSNNSWARWPIVLAIGISVFILVFVLLSICGKRRRAQQIQLQQQQQMGNVQMMPPPPPGGGTSGVAYGMPYNGGGPPAGYPVPPPQAPSSINFIPPPSGSSAYPSQPMNMGGQPSGGVGGGAGNNEYPAPQGVAQPAIWYAGGKPPS